MSDTTVDSYDLTGEIINISFSILSIIGSIIVFIMFFINKGVFKREKRLSANVSETLPLGGITDQKRFFIRRTMLSLCVSDIILGIFNIVYIIFNWCVSYGQIQLNDDVILNTQRLIGQFILAASMAGATWCICIAVAIYTTTKTSLLSGEQYQAQTIVFHLWGWGIGIATFLTWFIYRRYAYMIEFPVYFPRDDQLVAASFYLVFSFYMFLACLINLIIVLSIWRYVSTTLNAVQVMMKPKKATRRAKRRIITRLSFYLVPFLFSGSFQMIWYFYLSIEGFRGTMDYSFVKWFTFVYNIFFPMHGFLNVIAYGVGLDSFDRCLDYIIVALLRRSKPQYDYKQEFIYNDQDTSRPVSTIYSEHSFRNESKSFKEKLFKQSTISGGDLIADIRADLEHDISTKGIIIKPSLHEDGEYSHEQDEKLL